MADKNNNKRGFERKSISPLHVSSIASLDDLTKIAKDCDVIEASANGLLLHFRRESLIPTVLRNNLNIDSLIGQRVFLKLEEMNLELSGVITRTKLLGKQGYYIAVDYTDEAPLYWRECLMDLLPQPGELD
ncbi:MAG: hypothetical protein ACK5WZ_07575 [Pseudobdellovibrionaceae bacterium]|jgi:hypothetical protein